MVRRCAFSSVEKNLSKCYVTYTHGGGRYASEKLTRAQALKGMTLDAAFAAFSEDRLGSLTTGKKADYVVLDRDIVSDETPAGEILQTKVLATVIDGRIAHGTL